jgi:hypothetical protein
MNNFDIQLLGYSDLITRELGRRLGWIDSSDPVTYTCGKLPNVFCVFYSSNGFLKVRC